jgi:glutaminyl-peptide cyclotransferase
MTKTRTLIIFMALAAGWSCKDKNASTEVVAEVASLTPIINYAVTTTYPHDTTAYTEGFLVHEGKLFESTGATDNLPQTRSLFGQLDLATGLIQTKVQLDGKKYFGEGIVFFGGRVYQLTYLTKIGFVYDAKTFQKTGEFTFPSQEGWGMTTDGHSLVMSDGTDTLTWLDPVTFGTVKKLAVSDKLGPVRRLNELEFINGYLYANVYGSDYIMKIDPASGMAIGKLDLSSINSEAKNIYAGSMEMNGIAYDSASGKVYVTGKMWPKVYEISFPH